MSTIRGRTSLIARGDPFPRKQQSGLDTIIFNIQGAGVQQIVVTSACR
jgi:hypothetical protein